jgi:hypothetical protein
MRQWYVTDDPPWMRRVRRRRQLSFLVVFVISASVYASWWGWKGLMG